MSHDLGRRLEASLLERAHEVDAAARRVGLGAQLEVRRAGGLAEAAVHAGEQLVDVDEALRGRGAGGRPHREDIRTSQESWQTVRRHRAVDAPSHVT